MDHFFEEIIVTYQARIRAYIAGLGVSIDMVDDIAQDVFIQYYRTYTKKPDDVDVFPWLKGIAKNISYNYFRSEKRRTQHHQAAAEILDKTAPFSDKLEEGELSQALHDCVGGLPPKNKKMVFLRYEQGFNSQKISEELTMSGEAIRMALMRIRAVLKECIEKKVGGEPAL